MPDRTCNVASCEIGDRDKELLVASNALTRGGIGDGRSEIGDRDALARKAGRGSAMGRRRERGAFSPKAMVTVAWW